MNKLSALLIFTVALLVSCDDILEKDIEDDTVELRTPADGYETTTPSVSFWWEPLDGASSYELLIASPDLQNSGVIVLDTTITGTQFTTTLEEGQYQWCVKGINGGYETGYNCRSVKIADVIEKDITLETVLLRGPSSGNYQAEEELTFWWDALTGATQYEFLIVSPDFQNPGDAVLDTVLTKTQFKTTLEPGQYQWCVKAVNTDYETSYNCVSITIEKDITDVQISLQAPSDGYSTAERDITLRWNVLDGATKYELVIVSPNFENPNVFMLDTVITKTQFATTLPVGQYDWCVKGMNANYKTEYNCRSVQIKNE